MRRPQVTRPAAPVVHAVGAAIPADAIDQLVDALESERRLLEELIAIMRRQRDSVKPRLWRYSGSSRCSART
jgi:hypothetical protein